MSKESEPKKPSCPYKGAAPGTFGSFTSGVIAEGKGYKAQGLRLKATKELSFNSAPCARHRVHCIDLMTAKRCDGEAYDTKQVTRWCRASCVGSTLTPD